MDFEIIWYNGEYYFILNNLMFNNKGTIIRNSDFTNNFNI